MRGLAAAGPFEADFPRPFPVKFTFIGKNLYSLQAGVANESRWYSVDAVKQTADDVPKSEEHLKF
jgi:hypothetical protein